MHMPKAAKHVWNIISTALVVLVVLFAIVLLGVRDAFVAYTRDSVQDKQSDYLGIDVSMLTEFLEENGYCCMMLHGTHFSQCYFLVMSSIYQDFSDMTDSQLEEQNALIRHGRGSCRRS